MSTTEYTADELAELEALEAEAGGTAPVDQPPTVDESAWKEKPKREKTAKYNFTELGFDLPDDEPVEREVDGGFKAHFQKLVDDYEAGNIKINPENGMSEWIAVAEYGNRTGAKAALKSIGKAQSGAAAHEKNPADPDGLQRNGKPYKRILPVGYKIEIRVVKPKTGSVLAARVLGRS